MSPVWTKHPSGDVLTNINTTMKTSLKEVLTSDAWIVTKVIKGYGKYRVDARRRYPMADAPSFFSEWGSIQYVNQLCRANYGKNAEDLKAFNQ